MVQYVITPWRNRTELLLVREKLHPHEGREVTDEERKQAVAKVSVWMQRGNCPHLVESTAILTAAVLNDVSGNSTYCVRAAYSAAFCRFVTGLLDSHQDKRRKLSMYSIAKTIGLPATYVELRHQATHEGLPSLSKLRAATQRALRWIWDYYWVHLKVEDNKSSDCKAALRKIVQERDDHERWAMEESLSGWDQDELLGALIEIQGETDQVEILLRALQLHRSIVNGMVKTEGVKDRPSSEKQGMDIDALKADMARMEAELDKKEEVGLREIDVKLTTENDSDKTGWSKWQGPWIPKPIGVV